MKKIILFFTLILLGSVSVISSEQDEPCTLEYEDDEVFCLHCPDGEGGYDEVCFHK